MTRVRFLLTGRVVHADDDQARRWVEQGLVVIEPEIVIETGSRTARPAPAKLKDTETR
jgi:hypothetical protein